MIWYIVIFVAGVFFGLLMAAWSNVHCTAGTLILNNTDPEAEFFTIKLDGKNVDYALFESDMCCLKIDRTNYRDPNDISQK